HMQLSDELNAGDRFVVVRREELWVRGALAESRSREGQAVTSGRKIAARDQIDDGELAGKLRADCDAEVDRLRSATEALKGARVRGVVTAIATGVESTITRSEEHTSELQS